MKSVDVVIRRLGMKSKNNKSSRLRDFLEPVGGWRHPGSAPLYRPPDNEVQLKTTAALKESGEVSR
jgi:hypothetical protein